MGSFCIILWCAGGFFVLYVLFLYPLALAVLTRRRPMPPPAATRLPRLSILIPVRNGEQWIQSKLESVLELNYPRELLEILVISDGSDDRTEDIVREFSPQDVRLLRVPRRGKAAALNAGIGAAQGDVLLFTDVRQPLDPDCARILVAHFADPSVGVASGFEIIAGQNDTGLYSRYEKYIRQRQSDIDSVLGATGCIYAMRRELAVPLPEGTLCDDMYLPLAAFFRGYRIIQDDRARVFDYPAPLSMEFQRKVRTLAGLYQIVLAYPALLGPSNRMWIHFFSHKLGRLMLPFALLIVFAASFCLPYPWNVLALGAQTLFYGLAALDMWVPRAWTLKRITAPARAFVVLMAAAALALSYFFTSPERLWKETRVRPDDSSRPAG